MKKPNSSQSGVALLMALGILALLSILGATFSTNMRLMERTSRDFVYDMQARYLAEGGIEYAIAELKEDARNRFVYDGIGQVKIPADKLPEGASVEIEVIDTARQVNINNANIDLLDCLPGIGKTGEKSKGQAIINARNRVPFITKKSVCLASGVSSGTYKKIKDLITTSTYIDPNVQDNNGNAGQNRSAININTIGIDILKSIIAKVDRNNATAIANNIKSVRPIHSWEEFNNISGMTEDVKEAFNPNRKKSGSYYSTFPTEFCFHSGGTYELTATGRIEKNARILAQKTVTTTVKIFDLWNQTTKEQFRGDEDTNADGDINDPDEDLNGDGNLDEPTYEKITWLDTCPVLSNEIYWSGSSYTMINDSLKIGYWDDFNNVGYYKNQWYDKREEEGKMSEISYIKNGVLNMPTFGEVILGKGNRWNFEDSSVTINQHDNINLNTKRGSDVDPNWWCATGYFMFRFSGADEYVFQGVDTYKEGDEEYVDQVERCLNGGKEWYDSNYVQTKVYRILQKGNNYVYLWIDKNLDGPFDFSRNLNCIGRSASEGNVKLYMQGTWGVTDNSCTWDSLRAIPDYGVYTSVPSNIASPKLDSTQSVEWGTLWATVTLREPTAGKIYFSTSVDNFNQESELTGGSVNGVSIGSTGTSIRYRAKFECSDTTNYLTTPVMEDVWIAYLPKTKILYWREGEEE